MINLDDYASSPVEWSVKIAEIDADTAKGVSTNIKNLYDKNPKTTWLGLASLALLGGSAISSSLPSKKLEKKALAPMQEEKEQSFLDTLGSVDKGGIVPKFKPSIFSADGTGWTPKVQIPDLAKTLK